MMNIIHNIVEPLRPHFFSLREINDNVSLDIKIPVTWRYEELEPVDPDLPFAIKVQDKKTSNILISLISTPTPEGYEKVFNYASLVIKINREEEEKERLFNEKVQELKSLFLSSSLDKLKEISFNKNEDELSTKEGDGEIKLGSGEGSGTDRKTKKTTN